MPFPSALQSLLIYQLITLWEFLVCYCFSIVAFKILSLSLIFVSLITMCLCVFLLRFILPGILCTSWTWLFLFPCWGSFQLSSLQIIFLGPFSPSFPFRIPRTWMLVCLTLSQRSLRLSSFFFYILFWGSDFHHSVLQVTYPFFCLSYSAIDSF